MEVGTDRQPAEGEVLIYTVGGTFCVKGSTLEVAQRLTGEDWPTFELADSRDKIIIASAQVVALRGGTKARRGTIGFTHSGQE